MKMRIKSKIASLHSKMEITDENGQAQYYVHSKVLSLHNVTYIDRADGETVATLTRKPVSAHEVHLIEMADGTTVEIRTELWHVTKDILDIDELGWNLVGSAVQHDYKLMDSEGQVLAESHRKWLSLHNTYEVDVVDEAQMDKIVAVLVSLDKILGERQLRTSEFSRGPESGEG